MHFVDEWEYCQISSLLNINKHLFMCLLLFCIFSKVSIEIFCSLSHFMKRQTFFFKDQKDEINDTEHLFTCILAIRVSFLWCVHLFCPWGGRTQDSTPQWFSNWGHNSTDKIQINKRKTNRIYSTHAVCIYMGEIL